MKREDADVASLCNVWYVTYKERYIRENVTNRREEYVTNNHVLWREKRKERKEKKKKEKERKRSTYSGKKRREYRRNPYI